MALSSNLQTGNIGLLQRIIPIIGLGVIISFGYLVSSHRQKIHWKTVFSGLFLQIFLFIIILKTGPGLAFFDGVKKIFMEILNHSSEGAKFVLGDLASPEKHGFVFAFVVLPTIVLMSALMSFLYYIGVMQTIIKIMAKIMVKVMGTSGGESLACAANIFVGQTEAPLVVKPLLKGMTRSELMALMTGGMATVAGGTLAAYVSFGIDAGHLLTASVISAPAALVCAKLIIPETQISQTIGDINVPLSQTHANALEAVTVGAKDGSKLALNVVSMLLAFIALVSLVNAFFSWAGGLVGYPELSLELVMGYFFAPVAFLIGIPWGDLTAVGSMLGKKIVLNEIVAYLDLKDMINTKAISPRSILISTYALCGFANFASVAMQIGGIGGLIPSRQSELALLGMRSLIGGTMACLMTACVAAIFL